MSGDGAASIHTIHTTVTHHTHTCETGTVFASSGGHIDEVRTNAVKPGYYLVVSGIEENLSF